MPLYEYQCESCAHRFERIQKFSDPPVAACPLCGAGVRKLLSSPAIQFKGSGWYVTDYARKSGGGDAKPAAGESKGDAAGSKSGTEAVAPADPKPAKPSE
jgi:putative FmdB family regulatory protein